jgi:hypothetical protein
MSESESRRARVAAGTLPDPGPRGEAEPRRT